MFTALREPLVEILTFGYTLINCQRIVHHELRTPEISDIVVFQELRVLKLPAFVYFMNIQFLKFHIFGPKHPAIPASN